MKRLITIIFAGMVLSSCSSLPPQVLDPNVFYKRDIVVTVNDVDYQGVSVLPAADAYEMTVRPTGKMDLLLITTCHREGSFSPKSVGFFKKTNSFEYYYEPEPDIEGSGACPLRVDAFDRERGQHSWFFADFEGTETLPAIVSCNGTTEEFNGVSVCQSKAGLIQRIEFAQPVIVNPDSACPLPRMDRNAFDYEISKGECVYAFMSKDGEFHRHTSIGYEGVLVRE